MTMQFETTAVNGQISVPVQYRDRLSSPVTVIIISQYENKSSQKQQIDDGFGSLSKYANTELLAKENSAWELAMRDKYVPR
ncbi:MAG: hypothetical protein FWH22_07860 [Fibromonadales bacterium]|nr:hypothetical protein [Fibromonadales bacterium]